MFIGGSLGGMVAHWEAWWLIGRHGGSVGGMVAHWEAWWLIGGMVAQWEAWWLIGRLGGSWEAWWLRGGMVAQGRHGDSVVARLTVVLQSRVRIRHLPSPQLTAKCLVGCHLRWHLTAG